jgi:hypothetical protein
MPVLSIENNQQLYDAMPIPGSGRMAKYAPLKTDDTAPAAPALSEEEIEQKLDTADNDVKLAMLLQKTPHKASTVVETIAGNDDNGITYDKMKASMEKYFDVTRTSDGGLANVNAIAGTFCATGQQGGPFTPYPGILAAEGRESTPENPIMYVVSNLSENQATWNWTWYRIEVNQVDPSSATFEEMMAFISYVYKDDEEARFWPTEFLWNMVSEPELLGINIPGENGHGLNFLAAFGIQAERQFNLIGHHLASPGYSEAMYEALMDMVDKMGRHIEIHHPEENLLEKSHEIQTAQTNTKQTTTAQQAASRYEQMQFAEHKG